ncbi:MAG: YeiH family protein [Candidatus Sumerlaeaceae bacterium]
MSSAPKGDEHSWAEYMIYMEAGDIVSVPSTHKVGRRPGIALGLLATTVVALTAMWLSEAPVWPFTVGSGRHPLDSAGIAILLGMIIGNFVRVPSYLQPGIKFAVKKVLPVGIILLGARLNMADLVHVGAAGILLSVVEIALAMFVLIALGKHFGLSKKLAVLLGVGTGVCGGSAILATAPVIDAKEEDVVFSVAVVSLLGTIAMLLYPFIGHLLQMHDRSYGLWSGLTLYQTPQVVAAGFSFSQEAGETATIVKLARVCLLAPVVFLLGLWFARQKELTTGPQVHGKKKINYLGLIPTFVIGLFAVVLLRTMGFLPEMTFHLKEGPLGSGDRNLNLANFCRDLSTLCVVVSMAGAGLETKFDMFKKIGSKPLIAAGLGFVVVTAVVLALIRILPV